MTMADKKKGFQGETVGLEAVIFYYGEGTDVKWPVSKEKILAYIGKE